jgi:hypothetical protein
VSEKGTEADMSRADFGAAKDVGMFGAFTRGPALKVYGEREVEDCGEFGVFWYRRPTGHTKTSARHRGETAWIAQWALVRRAADGSWQIGQAIPGFATRDAAKQAAGSK